MRGKVPQGFKESVLRKLLELIGEAVLVVIKLCMRLSKAAENFFGFLINQAAGGQGGPRDENTERRQKIRAIVNIPVLAMFPDMACEVRIVEVSDGGMRVVSPKASR